MTTTTWGSADGGLEEALCEIRELIDAAVTQHRGQLAGSRLINTVDGGYGEILRTAQELIDGAERTIDIIHGRNVSLEGHPPDAERKLMRGDVEKVKVRMLSAPALLDEGFVQEQAASEHPVAIKVARLPPIQALIVDGSRGLVVAESALGRRASVVEAPEILLALRTLMEGVWRGAVSAQERISFGDPARADLARQILGALREGVTDEVAARELTVSVRTYRRYVAEIMTLLGARSRFQAGVRAAELRLLPTSWTFGNAGPESRRPFPGRGVAAS
ncbi:helix-turn-helix transcriptional regulator [Streptomyces apocyni]|uniref:helix-turn-helix transcriptional regulator n=1 Tax=Streptomyces apocyni TaxID=2654677 RepID=UPI0012E9991E|nr:LuxR family transcriptional regulator [Streptomyces apocyni]